MSTYRTKIGCGNCSTKREYDIERGVPLIDAELVCPNCGCDPTSNDYTVFIKTETYGKGKQIKE